MMMTALELIERTPDPTKEEVQEGLEGNICRCTSYQNIVEAVQFAVYELTDETCADGGDLVDAEFGGPSPEPQTEGR